MLHLIYSLSCYIFIFPPVRQSKIVKQLIFPTVGNMTDILFRLRAWYHNLTSAAKATNFKIHPTAQNKETVFPTWMILFHCKNISYPNIHLHSPFLSHWCEAGIPDSAYILYYTKKALWFAIFSPDKNKKSHRTAKMKYFSNNCQT